MKRVASLWGPVAAWMGAIYAASSVPVPAGAAEVPDWLAHGAVYLVLGLLLCRALAGGWGQAIRGTGMLAAVALATAYGVGDELHQSLVPGRDPSLVDVASDCCGALIGVLLYAPLCVRARSRAGRAGPASAGGPARSRERR